MERSDGAFKIMYRDERRVRDGVRWDGQAASFFALREIDEEMAQQNLAAEGKV